MADAVKTSEGFKFILDEDMVRQFLQEALIKALAPEQRDQLVTSAIRKLLEGTWNAPSDLQRIFASAASDVARKLAEEEFLKPENVEKLRSIVAEAWDKRVLGEGREELVKKVGDAIARGVFGDRY